LAFLVTAIVSLWAAFDRSSAGSKFWLIVGAILLYYAFANWAADRGSKALSIQAWMLAVIGPVLAVYLMLSHDWDAYPSKISVITQIGQSIRSTVPTLSLERFHPNVLAGAMALMIPFSAGVTVVSWNEGRRREFVLGLGLVLFTAAGLFMSGSRGTWVAIAGAFIIVIWWLVTRLLVVGRRRRRSWFVGTITFVLLSVAVIVIVAPNLADKVFSGLPSLESGLTRADLYRNSLILINDYPFIGAGLDNFMMLYSSYALLLHVGFSTHGHNLLLDLTIQQGIIAVFIFLWMLLLMGEAVWRVMRVKRRRKRGSSGPESQARQQNSRQGVLLGTASLSIFILVVHGLVDDAVYGTRMVVLMFVPFAFAVPVLIKARTPTSKEQVRAVLIGVGILALILIFTWRPVLSLVNSNLAAVQQGKAELGVYKWPDWPVQDAVRREVDLVPAVNSYERALSLNPGNASANRRLGQIELSTGEYEDALRHLKVAYAQAPWDNATRIMLGEAYLANGRVDDGAAFWSLANNDQGQLDLRTAWYKNGEYAELFDHVKSTVELQR